MSSSALEPLLPAGKKISSVRSGPAGFARCRLVVDGQVAVTSIVEQWRSGTTLGDVAYGTCVGVGAVRLSPGLPAQKTGSAQSRASFLTNALLPPTAIPWCSASGSR